MRAPTVALCLIATPALADVTGPARVIDGDTLEIQGQRIRLHGIDAPETRQTCWDDRGEFPCGQRAKFILAAGVKGQTITCEERDKDRYGRTVAVCYDEKRVDLGRDLVRHGWALAYRDYSLDYVPDERKAQRLKMGLWQSKFTRPCKWRMMMRQPKRDPDEFQCQ